MFLAGMDSGPQFDEVLRGAQVGAEWAFSTLYRSYHPRVERYVRGRLGAVDEDIAADVWLSVARGIRSFTGEEANFRVWLFTIASRRIADRQRSWARNRTDVVDPDRLVELPGRDDPASSALDGVSGGEAVARMAQILTPDQSEVVLLRILGGLGVTEVAALMGRTENWVRVTQHRALRRMADRLAAKVATA
jgi:RNA polymerase sigma factor (sigma-70 family)